MSFVIPSSQRRTDRWCVGQVPRRLLAVLLFALAGICAAQTDGAGGSISGLVKSGNMPLPGVTVTATNTLTGQKVTTWTDVAGGYVLQVPTNGRYVIRAQMAAFAPMTGEAPINADNRSAQLNLEMILLSRVQQPPTEQPQQQASALGGRGFQTLSVFQGEGGEVGAAGTEQNGMSLPGAELGATESVAVSGNVNNSALEGMNPDEWRQRVEEMRQQSNLVTPGSVSTPQNPGGPQGLGGQGILGGGGGFSTGGGFGGGGFGGGGFGGGATFAGRGGGSGGRRGQFDINRPHGTLYYSVGDSALNAAPYSLTGEPVTKPGYLQQRFGGAIGGPLSIPKLYKNNKTFFFLNYTGSRGENPFDQYSTIPTLAERAGDFSGAGSSIFDPTTNAAFPGNVIPASRINSAATGLLAYIPLPNVPGTARQNFHFVTSADNHSDDFNFRLNRSFGAAPAGPRRGGRFGGSGNNLSVGVRYHSAGSNLTDVFPSVGGTTSTRSIDIPLSYTHRFGRINNILRVDFNRSRIRSQNLYAFTQDITGGLGITGVSTNPFDWGLPGLSFTNFAGLQDVNPQLRRNQTLTFSDFMVWNRGKHTFRWGGDFRRIQLNTETDSNARGSFVFTGLNTAEMLGGTPAAGTGYDLADFLLGLPQQTSAQFGANNYHFRANSWDLFGQDAWRVRGNLTLNLGLRYEYVSPFSEIDNRLVNLDVSPGFTAAVPVLPEQSGPYNGVFPITLVKPDRNNFAPRLGLAWKVFSKTVFRAGYGINYNTTAYSTIVQQLAFQPPFSFTQTNVQSTTGELTLQNGFPTASSSEVTNNYGVDPNYRLGYVQIWNADIQQEISPTLIVNIDYSGAKGTRLDAVEAPNRTASGLRIPGVQPFNFQESVASSIAHAGSIRVRKRLQAGFSVGGTYTYSKSIDNASSIGGGATVVAQDAFDLDAERGLSSFDQRHRFTADYMVELPFGRDRRWLRDNGPLRAMFGDWLWTGNWTLASGLPFTPRVLGDFTDVSRGTNGTIRADLTGQPVSSADPSIAEWFNAAAFVAPPSGEFGNAGRNSIDGPGSALFNMAFTKNIPLSESRMLEVRAQFSNIFNTPQYTAIDTIVNSPTFGRVISVGPMRSIQLSARFRF